jgi:hypothetical protein
MGWNIKINRQQDGGKSPGTLDSPLGAPLAYWPFFSEGRQWLRAGKAIDLGGNDYPSRYTAKAEVLAPWTRKYPPGAILKAEVPVSPDDEGQDRAATGPCPPEEWLIVEVWDTT